MPTVTGEVHRSQPRFSPVNFTEYPRFLMPANIARGSASQVSIKRASIARDSRRAAASRQCLAERLVVREPVRGVRNLVLQAALITQVRSSNTKQGGARTHARLQSRIDITGCRTVPDGSKKLGQISVSCGFMTRIESYERERLRMGYG
jgi:hypothetical protein